MKTTTVEIPSVYADCGKLEASELSIRAELDSNLDIVYLIYGSDPATMKKTLIDYTRDLDEAVSKYNDLLLIFLNRQVFKLKQIAKSRE